MAIYVLVFSTVLTIEKQINPVLKEQMNSFSGTNILQLST